MEVYILDQSLPISSPPASGNHHSPLCFYEFICHFLIVFFSAKMLFPWVKEAATADVRKILCTNLNLDFFFWVGTCDLVTQWEIINVCNILIAFPSFWSSFSNVASAVGLGFFALLSSLKQRSDIPKRVSFRLVPMSMAGRLSDCAFPLSVYFYAWDWVHVLTVCFVVGLLICWGDAKAITKHCSAVSSVHTSENQKLVGDGYIAIL